MKTQSIYTPTTRSLLTLAVMVMVLLLVGSRAATATIVPSTYNTDTFPFYGGPPPEAQGWDSVTGNTWYLNVTQFPNTTYDTHELVYAGGGQIYEYWWYGFGSGGAFTLAGPGATFSGYFNQGSGTSYQVDTGPPFQSFNVALTYTGQWTSGPDTGLYQAGTISISEWGAEGFVSGPADLTMGPAPEPSSIMLFGSGILGLAGILRRRLRS